MKKSFLFILSITAMACFLILTQPSIANVYSQFKSVSTRNWGGYFDLDPSLPYTKFQESEFKLYNGVTDTELDDGYVELDLGFSYRYNNKDYNKIYISINGFVTFGEPNAVQELTRDPYNLFRTGSGIPTNALAPYWGDHKYWERSTININQGRAPSEIGYVKSTIDIDDVNNPGNTITVRYCLVQWLELNINWTERDAAGDRILDDYGNPIEYKGNVASFQLIIYEGPDDVAARQGDIEFRYGNYGLTNDQKTLLVNNPGMSIILNPYNEAAVGVKGEGFGVGDRADFINALYNGRNYPADEFKQRNYTTLDGGFRPTGDPTCSIMLTASYSVTDEATWGDGDADMSKAPGGRHYPQFINTQNRFVTLNDVRTIMVSVATDKALDSTFAKAAFHADVHHDGRYYYLSSRQTGIFRVAKSTGEIVMGDEDPALTEDEMSQDTFIVRKVKDHVGAFGFLPYYGKNNNKMEIDFSDLGSVRPEESVRTVELLDPENLSANDYELRVIVSNAADRELMKQASEVNNEENKIRIKLKKNVNWRDPLYTDNIDGLPGIYDAKTQIFYEANEKDASIILSYLGGSVPHLPWRFDNPEWNDNGKVVAPFQFANNVRFNNIEKNNNFVRIPIYFNGVVEGPMSSSFVLNANIVDVESANNSDIKIVFSDETNKVVIVSDGYFSMDMPIAYITIENDENINNVIASNVRFDGEYVNNINFKLNTQNSETMDSYLEQNSPNPVVSSTSFKVTIPENNNYTLSISDVNGNLVNVIVNDVFEAGVYDFDWNASDLNGEKVSAGTYFYTLESDNISITKKLIVIR